MCFGALGAVATAFIATLGPQTGLRTMIITRFSSGYVGCTIYSILNILTQLGFSTTAVILGGQTLASINPGTLPLVVGIIIVGVCSLIPCFIGYHMVHYYERYAWMVSSSHLVLCSLPVRLTRLIVLQVIFIVMLFLWGLGGKAGFDINAAKADEPTGRDLSAGIISFGGIVFGSFSGVRSSFTIVEVQQLIYIHSPIHSVGTRRSGLQLSPSRGDLFVPCFHSDLLWPLDP